MSQPKRNIAHIRKDYQLASLDEGTVGNDPISFFNRWFEEAHIADSEEVNAMTLATVDADGKPHARVVLLKAVENNEFVFFTNYNSHKGREMAATPHVAIVFFWKELERQVRIEGTVAKISPERSDEYFYSRPYGSRLGAWSSPQSAEIDHREILEDKYIAFEKKFEDGNVPRPEHWGGYSVKPVTIEFWQGRSNRMHDRILFILQSDGSWKKSRLAP